MLRGKIVRRFLRSLLAFIILFVVVFHTISYRQNNQNYEVIFEKYAELHDVPYSLETVEIGRHRIFVVTMGNKTNDQLLILHGAPGNMLSYRQYIKSGRLLEKYQLIFVDRPGYGASSRQTIGSIIDQGDIIRQAINKKIADQIIVIGHSYGGPLALYLASQYPNQVKEALLLAAPIDPENEKIRPVSYIIDTGLGNIVFPRLIRASNEEKLAHTVALDEMLLLYKNIRVPISAWFGDIDRVVPSEPNAEFAQKNIPGPYLDLKMRNGVGHADRITMPHLVENYLLEE